MNRSLSSKSYKIFLQSALLSVLLFSVKTNFVKLPESAKNAHIVFLEDKWDEALKQAKAQRKYIFVDAYASWCGPCKMLKATTFTNEKVANFFNANFINISIDMEKGQGPSLAAQWQLQAYPTLIIFDPSGKPVLGTVGFLKADDLLKFAKQGLGSK